LRECLDCSRARVAGEKSTSFLAVRQQRKRLIDRDQVVAHWELSHARLPSLVIKKGALLSSLPFLAWFGCWSPPSNCSPLEKVGCPTRTLATIQFQRHALDPAAVRWEGGNQEICFARPGLPWFGSVLPFVFCGCRNNKTYGATTAIICSLFVRIFPSHRGAQMHYAGIQPYPLPY
jgi:hypothetical protein